VPHNTGICFSNIFFPVIPPGGIQDNRTEKQKKFGRKLSNVIVAFSSIYGKEKVLFVVVLPPGCAVLGALPFRQLLSLFHKIIDCEVIKE
jgi:hypothetical protein